MPSSLRLSTIVYRKFNTHSHSRNLVPVTQLYVSVDASTKESLKRIDRSLFCDFWLNSLEALAEKVRCSIPVLYVRGTDTNLCHGLLIYEGSKDSLLVDPS